MNKVCPRRLTPNKPLVGTLAAEIANWLGWFRRFPFRSKCSVGDTRVPYLLSLAMLFVAASPTHLRADPDKPTISAIRAHLFEHKNATWSEDILQDNTDGQWNSIAGPNASSAMLIVVEVSGPPVANFSGFFGPATLYKVRLKAVEGRRKVLSDQSLAIPTLSEAGSATIPFLIYHNGCKEVNIKVSLQGASSGQPVSRMIPFSCGE